MTPRRVALSAPAVARDVQARRWDLIDNVPPAHALSMPRRRPWDAA
jgi:hypothetical protein